MTLNDRNSSPQITHIFTFWVFFHIAGKTEDSLQILHTDRKYQLSLGSWDDKTEQKSAWLISGQLYCGTAGRRVFKVVRGYAITNIKLKMTNDSRMGVVKVTWPILKFCCPIISLEQVKTDISKLVADWSRDYQCICTIDYLQIGCASSDLFKFRLRSDILEIIQERETQLQWETNRELYASCRMAPTLIILSDFEGHCSCL